MFDLEHAVAGWRRNMLAAGIDFSSMEELESHLRDFIESLVRTGMSEKQAFEMAAQQVGQPNALHKEFKKVERLLMKKIAIVGLGIFAVLFGPAMILPALAKHRDSGIWNYDIVWPIVVGIIIILIGIGTTIIGFRKRRT